MQGNPAKTATTVEFLPQAEQAEQTVLASMVASLEANSIASKLLQKEHFAAGSWRRPVFHALQELNGEGRGPDALLNIPVLFDKLRALGYGNMMLSNGADIASLYGSDAAPFLYFSGGRMVESQTLANCELVIREALRRAAVKTFDRSAEQIAGGQDFDRVLDNTLELLRRMKAMGVRQAFETSEDVVNRVMSSPDVVRGLATGFPQIDRVLLGGGFQSGDYVILAARPSKGKTTVTILVTVNICRAGGRVLFVPLEMERDQMVSRTANILAGVTFSDTQRGYTDEQRKARNRSLVEIASWKLNWGTQVTVDPDHIFAQAMRMKQDGGIDAIVVDQLGLIVSKRRSESRQQEVANISRELKLMSLELKVPLIVPHQLSREGIKENKGRKMNIEHLRGSDGVGQDADTVIILQEPDVQLADGYEIEMTIAKQRKGTIGGARLRFTRSLGTFGEVPNSLFFGPSPEPERPTRAEKYSDGSKGEGWRSDSDDAAEGYFEDGQMKPF